MALTCNRAYVIIKIMKNPNLISSHRNTFRTFLAALALAAGGVRANSADAGTRPAHNQPTETSEFNALTQVITGLEQGKQADVVANNINVPGSISDAIGRPLVFRVGNQTYYAYTQGHEPNFDQKRAGDVANGMAIVEKPKTDSQISLGTAHLNKDGVLVDQNMLAVGYSIGGDTGK